METSLPAPHRAFLDRTLARLTTERWLVGIAASGSYATGTMDAFSDLDLTVVVEEEAYAEIMASRREIAGSLGHLLTCFTGEHVGEPRLLLCLYGTPLLHVDFVFSTLRDLGRRFDEPAVLWDRDGRVGQALAETPVRGSETDPQWYEDRFWVWVHKAAGKIARGELFEALEYLAFLRKRVLGPMISGTGGMRFLEARPLAGELAATVGAHDASACLAALRATVALYRKLREPSVEVRGEAERAVSEYLESFGPTAIDR